MSTLDLQPLLDEAFFHAEVEDATRAIEQARERFSAAAHTDGFSFEVVVPPEPDDDWLAGRVVGPLVYFCESTGAPLPACPGVFVSFFRGRELACVLAAEVLAWARARLGLTDEELAERYGTHELETAPR